MHGEFRIRFVAEDGLPEMEQIARAVEGAIYMNMAYFAEHPEAPCCLARAGVVYEEPAKCRDWCQLVDTAPVVLAKKRATCYSVIAYDIAQRRMQGALALTNAGFPVWAEPSIVYDSQSEMEHSFHATVLVPQRDEGGWAWTEHDPTSELAPKQCQCPRREAA